jgi:hypothetical protein
VKDNPDVAHSDRRRLLNSCIHKIRKAYNEAVGSGMLLPVAIGVIDARDKLGREKLNEITDKEAVDEFIEKMPAEKSIPATVVAVPLEVGLRTFGTTTLNGKKMLSEVAKTPKSITVAVIADAGALYCAIPLEAEKDY